jgi:competence protein ComEC
VISCGIGNSYGHPDEDTLSKLRDANVLLYRTDTQGTVTATSDGKTVTFSTERNAGAQTNQTIEPTSAAKDVSEEENSFYIGNRNSHALHSPNCNNLPDEKNRVRFDTIEAALADGYKPHKNCLQ